MEIIKKKTIPKPTYFGVNLKLLRRLGGQSQKELAATLNLTRNKIASYESGLVEPNANLFLIMSQFLKVDPKEMLTTVFTDHLVESIQLDTNDLEDQIIHGIEAFIERTDEMTRILNGYKTMAELKSVKSDDASVNSLSRAFEEVFELFELLIQHNWEIINQLICYDPINTANEDLKQT